MRTDEGSCLGMRLLVIKGWISTWSKVNLFEGSTTSSLEIRFLALAETLMSSLNVYWHSLMRLYVFFTSDV